MKTIDGRLIVFKSIVGSHSGNLNTSASDIDWKYFVCPNFDDLYLGQMYSYAEQSESLDYDVHDIRKMPELLWKGNLNFVICLFGKELYCDERMNWILAFADELAFMNPVAFYGGAMGMHNQKMSELLKGTAKTDILIEKFGYDTKQATHALRCLMVVERVYMGMGVRQALWFGGYNRDLLLQVKEGRYTLEEFKQIAWDVKKRVETQAVKQWFQSQKQNEELRMTLELIIKELIRQELRGN